MCLSQATISIPTSFVCDSVCVCVCTCDMVQRFSHCSLKSFMLREICCDVVLFYSMFCINGKKKLYYVYIYIVETLVPTAFCLMFLYKYVTHINTHSWSKNE